MNKRSGIFRMSLALVVLIVMFLPFLLTLFFFQAYRSIGLGLTIVLIAGLQLYTGTKQIQAAKGRGESIPWWKNYFIGLALTFVCFGALECVAGLSSTIRPIHDALGSNIGTLLSILFVLFTIGLGIYGIILAWQQIETNRRSRRPQ